MPKSIPTKLHIVRCLTDVAKEFPDYSVRIFVILFKLTVLDSSLSYKDRMSLLSELETDLDGVTSILPLSTEEDIGKYLDSFYVAFRDIEYTHPFSGDY